MRCAPFYSERPDPPRGRAGGEGDGAEWNRLGHAELRDWAAGGSEPAPCADWAAPPPFSPSRAAPQPRPLTRAGGGVRLGSAGLCLAAVCRAVAQLLALLPPGNSAAAPRAQPVGLWGIGRGSPPFRAMLRLLCKYREGLLTGGLQGHFPAVPTRFVGKGMPVRRLLQARRDFVVHQRGV